MVPKDDSWQAGTPAPACAGSQGGVISNRNGKTKIAIIDAHPDTLQLLIGALEDRYELLSYPTAAAALEFLPNNPPDLILIDLRLPGSEGWNLLTVFRSHGISAPAVAVTADVMGSIKEKAFGHGFDGFLAKPINIPELCNLIDGIAKPLPTHICDERFREIAVSVGEGDGAQSVLSAEESEHLDHCEECIARLDHVVREALRQGK